MSVAQQTRALLDLVEADRARQCAQILGDARSRADALRAQARSEALARLRQVFDEQRRLGREHVAAAQAQLATQRRLHAQQRSAALLQRAWQQLPDELQARWRDTPARAAWVAQVLASARERLPRVAWRIVHAPGWPADEQQALARSLVAELGAAPVFEADAAISAGLKVIVRGNVIDGTSAGLLADRSALAAQLLRRLETAS
jgi:acetyl/propionyl-CoA carboxylase alpha subunit